MKILLLNEASMRIITMRMDYFGGAHCQDGAVKLGRIIAQFLLTTRKNPQH